MPTFEIVAEEPALDSGTPATLPAKERKTGVRRFRALGLKDHARLLLPFLAVVFWAELRDSGIPTGGLPPTSFFSWLTPS